MPETFIFIALITVGVIVALQGIQTMRGRYKPRANIVEHAFVSTLEIKDHKKITQIVGRLRVVYGLFFVILGIWALL